MRTHARNTALAAERISRRFMEDELRRSAAGRLQESVAPKPWEREDDATPDPPRADLAPRFDVVRGGLDPEAPPRAATVRAIEASPAPAQVETPARQPFIPSRSVSWAPVAAAGQSTAVEQYRRLAAALIQAQVEHGVRVVMITSSVAGEGKSLTAANLAVTLARSYKRHTLIIDGDQREPSQHEILHVENTRGLSDYLRGHDGTAAATVELFPGLALLPAGRPTSDPMGGLTSARMKQLLAEAAGTFDFVIVDTPPAALIPDAGLLAPLVDTAVLVIAAGTTQFGVIDRAIAAVGRERILGTVLNRAEHGSLGRYGYGYGQYGA